MSKFLRDFEAQDFVHWAFRRWIAHKQIRIGFPGGMTDAGYCLDNQDAP